jgi:hypothetical protein
MGHIVAAPLVIVRTQEGGHLYLYEGMPVPANADKEDVERLDRDGFFADSATSAEPAAEPDEAPSGRPAGNASREEWATYAVESGKATDEEVQGLSRDELRGLYS